MNLTTAQQQTIKNYVLADPVLNSYQSNSDGAYAIATALNMLANPDFFVFNTKVLVSDIYDNISWAKYTPTDAPDNTVTYQNRALICQLKLDVVQMLLLSRTYFDASKATQVQGLKDALTSIPSGSSGANLNAGWTSVQNIIYRKATILEKLLANGTGTTAAPATMAIEGFIYFQDVMNLMGW